MTKGTSERAGGVAARPSLTVLRRVPPLPFNNLSCCSQLHSSGARSLSPLLPLSLLLFPPPPLSSVVRLSLVVKRFEVSSGPPAALSATQTATPTSRSWYAQPMGDSSKRFHKLPPLLLSLSTRRHRRLPSGCPAPLGANGSASTSRALLDRPQQRTEKMGATDAEMA